MSGEGPHIISTGPVDMRGGAYGDYSEVHNDMRVVHAGAAPETDSRQADSPPVDSEAAERVTLGVVTVLPEETAAVLGMLGRHGSCDPTPAKHGCYVGRLGASPGIAVAVAQATQQGNQAAMAAVGRLRATYAPDVIAVVGIAGAVTSPPTLGDVVIADQVIHYDLRKETDDGPEPGLQAHPVPAPELHAINAFFTSCRRMPAQVELQTDDAGTRDFSVFLGAIGSGNAVVASRRSWIRRSLRGANRKVLAVEMEGAGLAHSLYEETGRSPCGWLVIRGISDLADPAKDDSVRSIAAENAAAVFVTLAPHLQKARSAS